jgi:hypothetical protein
MDRKDWDGLTVRTRDRAVLGGVVGVFAEAPRWPVAGAGRLRPRWLPTRTAARHGGLRYPTSGGGASAAR